MLARIRYSSTRRTNTEHQCMSIFPQAFLLQPSRLFERGQRGFGIFHNGAIGRCGGRDQLHCVIVMGENTLKQLFDLGTFAKSNLTYYFCIIVREMGMVANSYTLRL